MEAGGREGYIFPMQKFLIALGIVILAAGLLWPWISRVGWGRLPGDFAFNVGDMKVYVPLATSIVLSIVLTLLVRFFNR